MAHEITWGSSSILGHAMLAENVATFSRLHIVEKNIMHPMTLVAKGLLLICRRIVIKVHDLPNVRTLSCCLKCLNEDWKLGFISELGE